ncbi:MAG: abortive infection system antitoxin AbiGi family protein [Candidatus Solibacter sp.]
MIKVVVPKLRRYNAQTQKHEVLIDAPVILESSPVCCLADIPTAHLSYHASRYGKIAIGFHRDAAVRHGFNPVFYTLHTTAILRSLNRSLAKLDTLTPEALLREAEWDLDSQVRDLECEHGHPVDLDKTSFHASDALGEIEGTVGDVEDGLRQFLAFIKTFDQQEFSTIYCEREWRATAEFKFTLDDVAMIVLPKSGDVSYFDTFVSETARKIKLRRSIPIIPWEDLVEH